MTIAERFWAKVDRSDLNGCWLWTAYRNRGYGELQRGPRGAGTISAHRFAYELLVGPVPEGLELDHLCRNPACCNPSHLEPVTHKENILRGNSPYAKKARQTHCKRGHRLDEANTYWTPRGTRNCRRCRADAERDRQRRLKVAV